MAERRLVKLINTLNTMVVVSGRGPSLVVVSGRTIPACYHIGVILAVTLNTTVVVSGGGGALHVTL